MAEIVVIASFVVGMTVRLPRMPYPGESLVGDLFDYGAGGKGTNMAITAARQGRQVAALAKIGQDTFGDLAVKLYHDEGISSAYLIRTPDDSTAVGLVYLQPNGENTIGVYRGANWKLTPEEIHRIEPELAVARVMLTQLEIPDDTVRETAGLAHHYDIPLVLNPAPVRAVPADILSKVDILTPNEGEAKQLAGLPPDDQSTGNIEIGRRLLDLGVKKVVITLGAGGCLIVQPGEEAVHLPAYSVQAIDTVGAGDAFNGGLAVALAEGKPFFEAVRWANATAALSTQSIGAIAALPNRVSVENLIQQA
jgi:ribokinase